MEFQDVQPEQIALPQQAPQAPVPSPYAFDIKHMSQLRPTKEELLAMMKPLIPEVKDGETPTEEMLMQLIARLIPDPIPGKDGAGGKDGSPDNGEQIVDKVNRLKIEPEYQIDFAHIKNFPWHLVKQASNAMGLVSWGGSRVLTVSGTIDDSNTSFTVGSKPTVLVINGGMYQESGGAITWSYDVGTLTLSVPVGTGGSVFGLQ